MGGAGLLAATSILVTVLDPSTGLGLAGLTAEDFTARGQVRGVAVAEMPVAAIIVVDNSVAGGVVRDVVREVLGQLGGEDRMALAATNPETRLLQGFTGDPSELRSALARAAYEGNPRLLDGLAESLEMPFPEAPRQRNVLVLITAGIEGVNRVREAAIVNAAKQRGIALYVIYLHGSGRWVFDGLTQETGGAHFWTRESPVVAGIWDTIRRPYLLQVAPGAAGSIKVKGREKTFVSSLPFRTP